MALIWANSDLSNLDVCGRMLFDTDIYSTNIQDLAACKVSELLRVFGLWV